MGRLTWALIILNVIIFEIVFSMPETLMKTTFNMFSFSSPHVLEIWRFITSLFLHASASHLFFNMLGLYFFGNIIEEELHYKKFLLIYFISGIAGNLIYGFASPIPVVGASGCIFGLIGFTMLMRPKEIINLFIFPLPLGIIAIIYAVIETLLVYFAEMISGVAHVAHVAGLITGVLFAFWSDTKRSGKGLMWLLLFTLIIIFLGPMFALIIGIGNLFLGAVDFVVGVFLYGIARLIGVILW